MWENQEVILSSGGLNLTNTSYSFLLTFLPNPGTGMTQIIHKYLSVRIEGPWLLRL